MNFSGEPYYQNPVKKKGPGCLQKKSPGLLDFFSPGTMGPSEFLGPVLSRPVPGPSRDFPGRDSPAGKPSMYVLVPYFADCFFYVLSLCRISEGLPVEKK